MKTLTQYSPCRARWLAKPIGSGAYRQWLVTAGSLTRRLQASARSFSVTHVRQHLGRLQPDEAVVLDMRRQHQALLREVCLCCNGRPVVYAHSVLPRHSLHGAWRDLAHLGSRPLGAALFAQAGVMRTQLTYRKLRPGHPLYQRAVSLLKLTSPMLWARRSVFMLQGAPILVTEVFLPDVLEL